MKKHVFAWMVIVSMLMPSTSVQMGSASSRNLQAVVAAENNIDGSNTEQGDDSVTGDTEMSENTESDIESDTPDDSEIWEELEAPEIELESTDKYTIRISWEECENAQKYEIYRAKKKNGKYSKIVTTSKCAYVDDNVSKGTTYYYKVRAFSDINEERVESDYSSVRCTSVKLTPTKVSVEDTTATKVFLKWKNAGKSVKYIVYRSDKKDGNYKKLGVTKKNIYTDKKAKAKKTYYYKVVIKGKTSVGKDVLSVPSKVIKTTTKKKVTRTAYVGDSIVSGFDAYGVVKGKGRKVIAKIGVSSYNFYNGTIMDDLLDYKPDRIFISLGMNGLVGSPSGSTMDRILSSYKDIIKECKEENPDVQIVVLAISPTSSSATVKVPYVNKYNEKQKKMAEKCGVYYYDYTAFLKNPNGTLKSCYSGGDGIHWNKKAYELTLSKLNDYGKKLD